MGHIINFAVIHAKPEVIILLFDQEKNKVGPVLLGLLPLH